jgi:hypothetical protein
MDWTYLVRLALAHGMSPFLARGLDRVPADVPRDIRGALRSHLEDNRARNRQLAAILLDLLETFGALGVEAIPFKGPVLGAVAHGDFSLRRAGDLDVLVRPDDVSAVCRTLSAAGFRERAEVVTGRPLSAAEDAAHRRRQCEYAFERATDGVVVEPHWAIAPAAIGTGADYLALWTRARSEILLDRPVPGLAHEDLLVLLSIHGSKHEWSELRWICDLAALLARHAGIDVPGALDRARAYGCGRMLLVALGLCRRLFQTELPAAILGHLDRDRTAGVLVAEIHARLLRGDRVRDDYGRLSPFLIRVRERTRDRVRYAASIVLTPRLEHMRTLPLPARLHGLYVPIKLAHDYLVLPPWRAVKRARAAIGRAAAQRDD